MKHSCAQCGNEYKRISTHWNRSECSRPSLNKTQMEIATGLLMGDGNISSGEGNPYLRARMITKPYLDHLHKMFGIFSHGVKLALTAEESCRLTTESGFSVNNNVDDYHDIYVWNMMCHPELNKYEKWYSSGEKVWPDNIELTLTVMKHWYCGDGSWENTGGTNRISIGVSNEGHNQTKINNMFIKAGLPAPSNYRQHERKRGSIKTDLFFTVDTTKEIFDYMGTPLPGFEYKWPKKYHD